jgi:hypothetical protein
LYRYRLSSRQMVANRSASSITLAKIVVAE